MGGGSPIHDPVWEQSLHICELNGSSYGCTASLAPVAWDTSWLIWGDVRAYSGVLHGCPG